MQTLKQQTVSKRRLARAASVRPPGRLEAVSDAALMKLTAQVIERMKRPDTPPSVAILEALKRVRDATIETAAAE